MKKDVIYIDNDDEITSITDKVQSSESPIVALVLPKRCTVLQSSINMKILNRAAKSAKKNLVIVTNEAALMPVAGAAGVMVSKSLDARPSVPVNREDVIQDDGISEDNQIVEDEEVYDTTLDKSKSIGELADDDVISLGSDDEPYSDGDIEQDVPEKKDKKIKKIKVPNFDSFRTKLFVIGGAIIFLGGGWYLANNVLPKVTVNVTTQNVSNVINASMTAKIGQQNVDTINMIIPAKQDTLNKNETKTFTPTGKKDIGTTASGSITLYVTCSQITSAQPTVPAGTQIRSSNGLIFITQGDITFDSTSIHVNPCYFTATVNVVSQIPGDQNNLASGTNFTASSGGINYTGSNSKGFGGGKTNLVTAVSQADCDGAKNALLNGKSDSYKTQLQMQLKNEGFTGLTDTFVSNPGTVTCSPAVGAQGSSATVTVAFSSTMIGASTSGMTQLITLLASKNLASSQSVLNTGLDSANETIKGQLTGGSVSFDVSTTVVTGIKQDAQALAKSIVGMKKGDAQNYIQSQPGVTSVSLSYSPFWVSKAPKNVKHITVNFANNGN